MESTQVTPMPLWPPMYTVKKSTRSKQVRLSIHPHTGLTIHLPHRSKYSVDIESLLIKKKSWILKHLASLPPPSLREQIALPAALDLKAIDETWQIEYKFNCTKPSLFAAPGFRLVVLDKAPNLTCSLRLLHTWLKRQAETHLAPWLSQLSLKHNLPFNKVQIRHQKTLWGSCSSAHNIQLNYKLLFLPRNLAEHVLLHELSHTKHLNHSRSFWRLLSQCDPNCAQHNSALRNIESELPAWLYTERLPR